METPQKTSVSNNEEEHRPYVILALQGGGALGAYQVGVYQALHENNLDPEWVTGISIGAINAALIAGNREANRVASLREFWDRVTSPERAWDKLSGFPSPFANAFEMGFSVGFGQPGFFCPWPAPPPLSPPGEPPALSYYCTEPLRKTLTELVNFDLLNTGQMRLSLGATRIYGGKLEFFDNHDENTKPVTPDHVLASGAFPPSFPPIKIGGNAYWDGGVIANTSVRYLADRITPLADDCFGKGRRLVIISVNLWQPFNPEPKTMTEVLWRVKQIQYSSGIQHELEELKDDLRGHDSVKIIGAQYRSITEDMPFGDADFSHSSISRRIEKGFADMRHIIEKKKKELFAPPAKQEGVGIEKF